MTKKIKNLIKTLVISLIVYLCLISHAGAVSDEGLVAYFNFDEGEGDITFDLSGNCNDGIVYGAAWTPGKYENALLFNGINNYVNIPYSDSLNITEDITIEAWVKQNILMDPDYNIVVESQTDYGWFFGTTSGKAAWLIGNPVGYWNLVCVDETLTDGWNHIAGTYKASTGTANLYLNGNLVISRSGTAQPNKHPGGFKIGLGTASNYPFNGTIDEVKIYNRTLSASEIKEEYTHHSNYDALKPAGSQCSKNSDCRTENCFEGVCRIMGYCENDSDCSFCQYCDINESKCKTLKLLGSQCSKDIECETKNCLNGTCRQIGYCKSDPDCSPGEYCENNNCEPLRPIGFNCTKHSQCETKTCVNGICRETGYCNSDPDCPPDKYCKNNKCENLKPINSSCSRDPECETKNCLNGVCRNKGYCNVDPDCYAAQYCDNDNTCKNLKGEGLTCSKDKECETKNCYYETCREAGYTKFWSFIITIFTLIFTAILFFLPGFALTLIKKNIPLYERILMAIGLSISLNIIGIFILNHLIEFPINYLTITAYSSSFLYFGLIFYYFKEKKLPGIEDFKIKIKENINDFKNQKIKILNFTIILFAVLFIFTLHYGIHDYNYPYHTDEWQHLARAVQIMDAQTIPDIDPYFNKHDVGAMNLEIGFHVFLAEFFILSKQDPVLFYKFLAPIFTVLASLVLFMLVKKITTNFYAGVFSMLFFASLKSAITILGGWFFVPLSMCFMLIFLFMYLFIEGMRKQSLSYFLFASIIISCIALIHPQSASWIYPVMILYLILFFARNILKVNLKNILKFKKVIPGISLLFFLPFLSFFYFFKILWKGSFDATLSYFITQFIVFRGCPEHRGVCDPNFIINFYGEVAMILAIIGVIYLLYKFVVNRDDDKFNIPILISWIFVMLFLISLLHVELIGKFVASLMGISYSPFTLLTGYIRIIYEMFLCLCALSGIGLYAILISTQKIIYKFKIPLKFSYEGVVFILVSLIIFIFIFNAAFSGYYDSKVKIYKDIDDDDYKAIKWLGDNYGNSNVVFARPHVSETIYPISKNYVVSITPHAGIPTTGERVADTNRFFMGDCNVKKEILNKYEVDYVFVKYKIKCDFLKEIYHEKSYIYEFEEDNL